MTDHLPRRMKIYAVGVERRTGKNAGTLKLYLCPHPGDAETRAARMRSLGHDPVLLFVATVAEWEQIDEIPTPAQRRARTAPDGEESQ